MSNSTKKTNLRYAKEYQEKYGFITIPLKYKEKDPVVQKTEFHHTFPTEAQLEQWHRSMRNVAIVTGCTSKLVVVDLDDIDAQQAYNDYCEKHGETEALKTPRVETGKGIHLYYQYPFEVARQLTGNRIPNYVGKFTFADKRFAGLDIRGDEAYVVAPPSIHPERKTPYTWHRDYRLSKCKLAKFPDWLSLLLIKADAQNGTDTKKQPASSANGSDYEDILRGVGKGQRNATCARIAGHFLSKGVPPQEVIQILYAWNLRNQPPWTQVEAEKEIPRTVEKFHAKRKQEQMDRFAEGIRFTDGWNGQEFIRMHGDSVRFCAEWNRWLIWDGKRFEIDKKLRIQELAKQTVRQWYKDAADGASEKERRKMAVHAYKNDSQSKRKAMIEAARSEPGIPVEADELDAHTMLFNCANGTIDFKSGELMPHDQAHLLTKVSPVAFDESADCPVWKQSLQMWFQGDTDLIRFIQKAVAYSATADISEQCLFILHGEGENGKSVFIKTIKHILGDYAQDCDPDLLVKRRNDAHPTNVADLLGARWVSTIEIGENARLNEPLVKRLTGGDALKARFMRENFFEFLPTHKLWIAVNKRPTIRETDHGMWRRIRLVPFNYLIPKEQRLPMRVIETTLQDEASGILNWILEGVKLWQDEGLEPPRAVSEATNAYKSEQDVIEKFFDECCSLDESHTVTAGLLYETYKNWCDASGEFRLSLTKFGKKIEEKGYEKRKNRQGRIEYSGVGVTLHNAGGDEINVILPEKSAQVSVTHEDSDSVVPDDVLTL